MRKTFINFLIPISFLFACVSSKPNGESQNVLTAKELKPFGRTAIDPDKGLELISSASNFSFSFKGRQCSLFVFIPDEISHNYIQYTIDGEYKGRIRINSKDSLPIVLKANGNGNHIVVVYKATEAHTGPIYIKSISASNIRSIIPSALPIIEFIGNSITCGAAADISNVACGKGLYHDQHNAYMAYGPRLSRALGAHFILSSVSGIGIYRNWNSDGPGMPELYEKTRFRANDDSWDFKIYKPEIVSIALGTNDLSNGDGVRPRQAFDSAKFVNEYVKFIQKLHSIYPDTKIALLSSPMIQGARRELLQNCLIVIKTMGEKVVGKPIAIHFFKPMETRGCTGHPAVDDHAIMAEELLIFFKELLKNN